MNPIAAPTIGALTAFILASLATPLPAEQQRPAGLELFDALGLPPVGDALFVRVATGRWLQSGREDPVNQLAHGFVLDDRGETFDVLTDDLLRRTLARTPPGTAEHARVGYEPIELHDFVQALLDEAPSGEALVPAWKSNSGALLAFYAWACDAKGDERNARALAGRAFEVFGASAGSGQREPAGDLRAYLSDELGHGAMWRLIVDFGDPSIPFRELYGRAARFLEVFPDHRHAERALEVERILGRMLADADARPAPAVPFGELPAAEQAAELVFRLREQNGHQWSQPGACDVFADPRGEESPAALLRALGLVAAPALIDALDDDSFTRCVGFHRNFRFSHHVLRVADCARIVLGEIAGVRFEDAPAALRWLADMNARGEKAVWIDGARAGNLEHALRLAARYPADAWPPIRDAFLRAGGWQRGALVALAGSLADDAARAFVQHQLRNGPDLRCRLNAAIALIEVDRDAVIDVVIGMWRDGVEGNERDVVALFLALTGEARAIDALGEDVFALDDDVLDALGAGEGWLTTVNASDGKGGWRAIHSLRDGPWDAAALAAAERVCLRALEVDRSLNGNWGGVTNPRICDFAARALHQRWPERYAFTFDAPSRERARQVLELRNTARAARGAAPLADPAAVDIPLVPADAVVPLLARYLRVDHVGDRERIAAEVTALGAGALPHVARAIEGAARDQRPVLQDLARRLGGIVAVARFAPLSAVRDGELGDALAGMVGVPADGAAIAAIAARIVQDPPRGVGGFVLEVERDAGGAGIVLTLNLRADPGGTRGPWRAARSSLHFAVGPRDLLGSTGAGQLAAYRRAGRFDEFADAVCTALDAPFDASIEGRIDIRFER